MSVNATVQRIVDDLFSDQLVRGLEATEKVTWKVKEKISYDPLTGEVDHDESSMEIPIIAGNFNRSFPAANDLADTSRSGSLAADEGFVFQMQPLETRTSKQALADSVIHDGIEYMIKSIEVVRLGTRPMIWKVKAS